MSQARDNDQEMAREVAELAMLGQASDPAAVRRLCSALRSDNATIRQVAATSLGRIGNPSAVTDLLEISHDPATAVRRSALWALGQIGHPRAITVLQDALRDPDSDVRRAAVWALGRMDQNRALPDLIAAQADDDLLVRRSAEAVAVNAALPPHTDVRPPVRKRQQHRAWLPILMSAAGIFMLVALAAVVILWNQPLGPGLDSGERSLPDGSTSPSGSVSSGPAAQCGGPPVMKLLIVGLDSDSEGYEQGFADVIRVARIDFTEPGVILLGVPRDLWVTIPGLTQFGINEERIKTSYPYGNVHGIAGGGPGLLAQTLALNLGLRVDRYAATDFTTFAAGIDLIGGIDIYLPAAVGDAQTDPPYFPAGLTHMDGQTALSYARVRPDNTSDLSRMDRQNQIIKAIRSKLGSSDMLAKVPAMISQMRGMIATDLSPAEVSSLLCLMQKVGPDQTLMVRIEKPLVLSVTDKFGYERLLPNEQALRMLVRAFDAGDQETLRHMSGN